MNFLLDSSAWLAHLFAEQGVEQINELFDDPQNEISISALSIPEVYGRLIAIGREDHWGSIWEMYTLLFPKVFIVNETIAHQAIVLRDSIPDRLPTVDSLIAATAATHKLTLVHRDSHFVAIPSKLLKQIQLSKKR